MFDGWQRADIISALALGVSGLALLVSLFGANFSHIQTRIGSSGARPSPLIFPFAPVGSSRSSR